MTFKIELDAEEMIILRKTIDAYFQRYLLGKEEEKLFQRINQLKEE